MSPATFFLSPRPGSREGKRGWASLTAGPAPTQSLVPGPEVAARPASLLGVLSGCAKVVGNPEPGDQDT